MSSQLFALGALKPREGQVLPEVRTRRQASGSHSSCGNSVGVPWSHRLVA